MKINFAKKDLILKYGHWLSVLEEFRAFVYRSYEKAREGDLKQFLDGSFPFPDDAWREFLKSEGLKK